MSSIRDALLNVNPFVCTFTAAAELAPDLADVESHPDAWEAWTDADTWELGPDANADGVAPQPSDEDLAELAEMSAEASAREHLDTSERMTLAELVDRQADFYRRWDNAVGEMMARTMEALALQIRLTDSSTPADYEARIAILDREARDQWEAIGFEAGKLACGCHRLIDALA